jgi:hypothetical protein
MISAYRVIGVFGYQSDIFHCNGQIRAIAKGSAGEQKCKIKYRVLSHTKIIGDFFKKIKK